MKTQGIWTDIVRSLCDGFRDVKDGFPDPIVVRDGKTSFMAIKTEGGVMRRNQLT
ncbi:VRR-NUC domain-containing protein [Bradyrhizobium embrapense]